MFSKAKILAALGVVLGIFLAALKFINIGKQAQKAETFEDQNEIEHEVREAVENAEHENMADNKEDRVRVDDGDFSGFNDDKL